MRHLPKHLRPRWRYLAVGIETHPETTLDRETFQRRLWYAAQNLLGDPGAADADLSVVRFTHDETAGEAIVRVRRDETTTGRAAVACLSSVDGHALGTHVRGISGTIRACEERYLGVTSGDTDDERVVFDGTERTAHVRGDRVDTNEVGATTNGVRRVDDTDAPGE